MGADDPAHIRSLILIGHGGVGKTSLAEALLLAGGATRTLGRTADGTSNFDVEPEEQKRGSSIFAGFHHLDWKKTHVNVIDAPGAASFVHDASNCLRAATTAVLVVSPNGETRGEDEKVLTWAAEMNVPRIAFVSRMDRERASFEQALTDLARGLEQKPIAVAAPDRRRGRLQGRRRPAREQGLARAGRERTDARGRDPRRPGRGGALGAREAGRGRRREQRRAARALPRGRRADPGRADLRSAQRRARGDAAARPVRCGRERGRRRAAARLRGRRLSRRLRAAAGDR